MLVSHIPFVSFNHSVTEVVSSGLARNCAGSLAQFRSGRFHFKGIEKGGEGIVLEHAKPGTNWILYEDDKSPGQSIIVSEVGSPKHRELGGR